ncbi:MAG TPA: glycosyltransferase family 39 protein [Steroidobacteraceae bacterium]|nr:glycosyltransferase family 39 protein [Steroidobacteraceae bacterium]
MRFDEERAIADSRRVRRTVFVIIAVASLGRLALAASLGLSTDESYTMAIARRLALSYFDHPPLHLWLVGVWARLSGSEAAAVLRLPFVLLFAGSTWLMYRLTDAAYGARAGLWAVAALNLAPLATVGIASWILPDGPMVFFSLLAVVFVARALADRSAQTSAALGAWIAAGAAAGLALLSKYLAIFPVLGVGLYLLTSRDRRVLATPGPWLAALTATTFLTPVLLWNAQHAWVSFAFQGGRALPVGFRPARAALDLAGELVYLLPWTALALLYVLARAARRGPTERWGWLFFCLACGPIIFFAAATLWTTVLPHWPAIGWVFGFPLLGAWLAQIERTRPRLVRGCTIGTAGVLALVITVAGTQAATGWLDPLYPRLAHNDPTVDLVDWRTLRAQLAARNLLGPGALIGAVSWIDAGKIDYALGGSVPVLCLSQDPRGFAYLRDLGKFAGRRVLVIANARRVNWRTLAAPYFRRIEPVGEIEVRRGARPVVRLQLAQGIGLTPLARSRGSPQP